MPSPIDQQTTALDLFNYKGIEIRTALIDDEIWFVATDIARVLGYSEAAAMTRTLDDDEKGLRIVQTLGGEQKVAVISEPGLYSAIIRSRIESAKPFRRWVTHEVIPTIRKTGSYGQPDISTPAGVLVMAEQFAATAKQLVAATEQLEVQKPLVQQALTYQGGTNLTTRAEFAREVIAWAQEQGYLVKQKDVFHFLAKKLGMFVRGERSDAGQATLDALRRELAVTVKGTSETGHNFATGKLTTTGKAYAFERCTRYIEQNGTLELPVEIRAVS